MKGKIEEIKGIYSMIGEKIRERMEEFRMMGERGSDEDIFAELVFCILTPQSRARVCWRAVEKMKEDGTLFHGGRDEIIEKLHGIRFKYNKADYILLAREKFVGGTLNLKNLIKESSNPFLAREWLVKNIKGMGYKEASHFLRNVGRGDNFAILDRHILKNLLLLDVIDEIPATLSRKRYYDIEGKMRRFASLINIPLAHLDMVLWYKEAGEVFK